MRILIPGSSYLGGTHFFVKKALEILGHEVRICPPVSEKKRLKLIYYLKLRQIKKIDFCISNFLERETNQNILEISKKFKPDLIFSINWRLFPETAEKLKNSGIILACWVQDNPFDSLRFKYFPFALEFFNYLFLGDMVWEQNIRNLAPMVKIQHMVGAFDPEYFKPITITKKDHNRYDCNLSFAGSAYGMKAEGTYRAGILDRIANFGLKIWGDDDWNKYFKYYPQLKSAYKGDRLNFSDLNKLYQTTKININLPNPQLYTTFQQRVFEIAAAKGFQIVDYRSDIDNYFNEDEIVTFKNINELREKIEYFLKYSEKRNSYIEKAYNKVKDKHTYETRMKEMLEKINL